MSTPHKWAKEIHAFAENEAVVFPLDELHNKWVAVGTPAEQDSDAAIDEIRAALEAQPAAAPVAWLDSSGEPHRRREDIDADKFAEPLYRAHPAPLNQCDGCRRGLPKRGNIHYSPGGHSNDLIGCTADRYGAGEAQPAAAVTPHAWKGHAWEDQAHCAKCGRLESDPIHSAQPAAAQEQ